MKQRTRAELQEDCSRKSSDPCYLLTVGLQTSQTRAGDEVSTRLSLPRGDAPHQSQLHFCSVSLFRETERKDSSKQTQMVGLFFFSFFRSTGTPFSYSSVPRIVFYLPSLLQFQEHLGLRRDWSFRAATFPMPPSAQLQQNPSSKCDNWVGRGALGVCSGTG